ncbi:flagellar export chaperone FliS [Paenibacillus thailandensis]|uniref:Flagellar secretion chaperone FliS n=1 Tax=Paenibacillus thailandensis TaxID=393250 RepID=A0ABW5R3P7_9BACL
MLNSPLKMYQQASVQTAGSGQLLLMLYEGGIRFTKAASEAIHRRDFEAANTNLKKAQAIIHELVASLNHDYAIAKDLARIYEYLLHLLIQSNIQKNASMSEEVLQHLTELRDAWKQVVKGSGAIQAPEANRV